MNQHIIACPVLALELQAVLNELLAPPQVHLMDYSIHINPDIMEDELHKNIARLDNATDSIALLVGKGCHARQPITTIAHQCSAHLPNKSNCIELILGTEKTKALQQNRTAIMTPGWITMIHQSIKDGNWRVEDARMNLGWYDQILLLDTGVTPLDEETIMAFFELIQVPLDILPVNLAHFKKEVQLLLQP
ncbi:MAG: DUF1638 domain-containing protein [Spirochaetales bacterium]|jgi:hypothetical protein|nr:DUF1638 domain-containing protein [Spirochaetales bacterium]